jgi:glutathione synthase
MRIGYHTNQDYELNQEFTDHLIVREARRRGHDVFLFDQFGINGQAMCISYEPGKEEPIPVQEFDLLVLRKIPADQGALQALDQMEDVPPSINTPNMILSANKKYMEKFPEHGPATIFTSELEVAVKACTEMERVTLKPIREYGGRGIKHYTPTEDQERTAEEIAKYMNEFGPEIVIQEFLPEVKFGDKRVMLLDGKPMGAYLRTDNGQGLCNRMAGGGAEQAEITDGEQEVIESIQATLRRDGGYLVGIDFIGGKLIEVNATSPAAFPRINSFLDSREARMEERLIDFAEDLARKEQPNPRTITSDLDLIVQM